MTRNQHSLHLHVIQRQTTYLHCRARHSRGASRGGCTSHRCRRTRARLSSVPGTLRVAERELSMASSSSNGYHVKHLENSRSGLPGQSSRRESKEFGIGTHRAFEANPILPLLPVREMCTSRPAMRWSIVAHNATSPVHITPFKVTIRSGHTKPRQSLQFAALPHSW